MFSRTLLITSLLLSNVLAWPIESLSPRQNSPAQYIINPAGTMTIGFSDQTVNIGDITIDKVFDQLYSICLDAGTCDTQPVSISGDNAKSFAPEGETVTLTPNGDYPTWVKNGLLEALNAAVDVVVQNVTAQYNPPCTNFGSFGCADPPVTLNTYTVPAFWSVMLQDTNDNEAAPAYISVAISEAIDSAAGFCSTFSSLGSALAGAVNPVAGGIFTLLGLACPSG